MKAKLIDLVADGILLVAVGAAAISVWLVASEILITLQKLH